MESGSEMDTWNPHLCTRKFEQYRGETGVTNMLRLRWNETTFMYFCMYLQINACSC
jgi:hypothetical protein